MTPPARQRTWFTTLLGVVTILLGGLGSLFSAFALLLALSKPYGNDSPADPLGIFLIFILPPQHPARWHRPAAALAHRSLVDDPTHGRHLRFRALVCRGYLAGVDLERVGDLPPAAGGSVGIPAAGGFRPGARAASSSSLTST